MLRALHVLHPAAIAFENLDPVLGRPVRLDSGSLEAKLLHGGRGGYCYEQNGLFFRVLGQLGFAVSGLSARVLRGRVDLGPPPRSHMLLKVDVDGENFIADVGFGSLTLTAPLRLRDDGEQETPHGGFRLVPAGDEFALHAVWDSGWEAMYRFSLEEQLLQDYEAANWYRATHPDSPFVRSLMAARPLPGRRLGLLDNRFSIRTADGGETEQRVLRSGGEIAQVLEAEFGICLPGPRAELERGLERLVR